MMSDLSTWFHIVLLALVVAVAGLTGYALMRLWRRIWAAAIVASLIPVFAILGYFFYLEAQQPYGPFLAVVGIVLAIRMLPASVIAARVGIFVSWSHDDEA